MICPFQANALQLAQSPLLKCPRAFIGHVLDMVAKQDAK